MCGRYTLYQTNNFSQRFLVEESLDYDANYNISPGSLAPVVTRNSPHTVKLMKWGLIPSWSKEFKMTFSTFNARVETINSSRLYTPLLKSKRCLVPANGFYEWTKENGKIPHYIETTDQALFSFAGLYDIWHDPKDQPHYSFTIITTSANNFMQTLHRRMPVILSPADEVAWLDHDNITIDQALALLNQYDSDKMKRRSVSIKVNSTQNNGEELILGGLIDDSH